MKGLPRFIYYGLLSILILTLYKPAFACVCRGVEQSPCFAFQEAIAVFAGKVVDITEAPFQEGDLLHSCWFSSRLNSLLKGISTSQVTVATITGTDCDFGFQKGEEYFVYAY